VSERDPAQKQTLPIVTIVLVAINLAAFAFEVASGAHYLSPTPQSLLDVGGNLGSRTFNGEPWRLLSAMFLHAGVIHLAVNMFSLVMVGRLIEHLYGRAGYVAIYLFAGIVGGIASGLSTSNAVSVGASGAIFGVFAAVGAYLVVNRKRLDEEVFKSQTRSLLMTIGINVFAGLQIPGIDMRAHIGGLVTGFVASLLLASGKQHRARVVVVFVSAGLAFGAAQLIPGPHDPYAEFSTLEAKALDRFNRLMNDKASNEEAANVIEREILPTWRQGQKIVWSIDGLKPDIEINLRAYVDKREAAFAAMVDALRKQDDAAFAAAMNTMSEAETYLTKLKQPQ
jgi:rhomboid protease GluP